MTSSYRMAPWLTPLLQTMYVCTTLFLHTMYVCITHYLKQYAYSKRLLQTMYFNALLQCANVQRLYYKQRTYSQRLCHGVPTHNAFTTKNTCMHNIFATCKQCAYMHNAIHYIDVIMTTMACQITSLTVVYSTFYSDADQRKHQSSPSLAFVWGIHRDRWIPRTKGQLRGKCFHWWRHHVKQRVNACTAPWPWRTDKQCLDNNVRMHTDSHYKKDIYVQLL